MVSGSRVAGRLLATIAAAVVTWGLVVPVAQAADITPPVVVTASPSAETVVAVGAAVELLASAEDSLGAPVTAEAWLFSDAPDGTFTDLAQGVGSNTLALADVVADDSGYYRAAFPDGLGGRVLSAVGHLDVGVPPASLGTPTGPTSVDPGEQFQLEVTVTGDGPPSISWERAASADGPWTTVPGATTASATFTAPETPATTTYYRATAVNAYGTQTSDALAVTTTSLVLTPVSAVSVTNPSAGAITASWSGGAAGGASFTYAVAILDQFDQVVRSVSTSALSATFTSLASGSYRARVIVATQFQQSDARYSSFVVVRGLAQSTSLSATILRPFRDGFQDSIVLRASSTFATSGSVRVRNSSGAVVRTFTLASATSWGVAFNGRTAAGRALPFGAYRAEFVFGGRVISSRPFTIASSQVAVPAVRWSSATVFPARDGYLDTTRLTTTTSVPAIVKVLITSKTGKKVFTVKQSRRLMSTIVWSGRAAGKPLKAGRYKAKITVTGGEGRARSVVRYVSVSPKKRTAVSFTGTISAVNAFRAVVSGEYDTGLDPGSLALWSSAFLGDTIYTFDALLPASMGNSYSNLKLYSCGYSYSGAQAALLRLDSSYNTYDGWALGNSEACYGGSWPTSILNGRSMYWAVGNVGGNSSFYYVNYFKVTCTRYVLK